MKRQAAGWVLCCNARLWVNICQTVMSTKMLTRNSWTHHFIFSCARMISACSQGRLMMMERQAAHWQAVEDVFHWNGIWHKTNEWKNTQHVTLKVCISNTTTRTIMIRGGLVDSLRTTDKKCFCECSNHKIKNYSPLHPSKHTNKTCQPEPQWALPSSLANTQRIDNGIYFYIMERWL
jgi:hypothetical protein